MLKKVKMLAVLLVAQLVLAAGIGLTEREFATRSEPVPLLGFTRDTIDRITLEGPDAAKVTLARKDGSWILPDSGDFPANGARVEQLIEQLGALHSGTPVATSSDARERFKVSDDQFERRITLRQADETVSRLYLGSTPGVRLIHARNAESDAIHTVRMAAYDVPVNAADWEDKAILTLPKSTISSIEINGLQIKRNVAGSGQDKEADAAGSTPQWQAEGLADGKRLKPDAADKLAGLLADLRFDHVLGQETEDEYGMENLLTEISLTPKSGETLTYRLGKNKDKDEYTLQVSNRSQYFRLASYAAKSLIEAASEDKLLVSVPDADERETEQEQPADS